MAFELKRLENHSGSGAGAKLWTYDANSAGDNRAAVNGAGYFNDANLLLSVGDRIHVHASDFDYDAHVSAISSGVVTIAAVDAFA